MGFLDDIKNKAGELGDKAGDAFEVAKDKAGDLVETVKDKLDTDDDGDVDTADASQAFDSIKERVSGGGDAPADEVAAGVGGVAGAAGSEAASSVESVSDAAAGPLGEPSLGEPALGDPAVGDPALDDPALDDPAVGDPAVGDPALGDPLGDQVVADPLAATGYDTTPIGEAAAGAADSVGDLGVTAPDLIGDEDAASSVTESVDATESGEAPRDDTI